MRAEAVGRGCYRKGPRANEASEKGPDRSSGVLVRRWGWLGTGRGRMEEGQMATRPLCRSLQCGLESEARGVMGVS